jgi:hypothetical protein
MSDLEFSDQDDNYDFEDGNYGEEFEEDLYDERSSSPIPEDDTPECIYCGKSLLSVPHTCGATEGCKNKNSIIIKNCQCNWHKQLKKL